MNMMETETSTLVANTYFTRLKLIDVFERSFHLMARKPTTFLFISFIFVGLHASFQWLTTYLLAETQPIDDDDASALAEYSDAFTFDSFADLFVTMANWIVYYLATSLASGATVRVVAELYVGESDRNVTAALAIGTAAQHLLQLMGVCVLLVFVLVFPLTIILVFFILVFKTNGATGLWVFIVLCLFLMAAVVNVMTYHAYPVIVVEKAGIVESIRRSIRLTEGHRCEIFSILLLLFVFNLVLSVPGMLAMSMDPTDNLYFVGAVRFITWVFTSSFGSM